MAQNTEETTHKTEDDWRRTLTPEQFHVLREHGTERPGSSPLNDEKRSGTFVCAGCGQPLFSSDTKFESGTGWPSFWAPVETPLRLQPMTVCSCGGLRCIVRDAAVTSATCFQTDRRRRGCASA